jgi:small ligand-binding sensory domain FIST
MKVGAGLSTEPEARAAAMEAALAARRGLDGRRPDLAVVFASVHHAPAAGQVLEAVHEAASPAGLIGCVGEAVVGGSREVEAEPAVSVWLGALPGGAQTFHMEFVSTASGGAFGGWRFQPDEPGGRVPVHLMICDPFTFPADLLLQHLNDAVPGAVVVGGNASGAAQAGETVLFQDREIHRDGAVGARLSGSIGVRTLVSQGCRPIGDAFVVTRAEQNVMFELGGRPPLERLRETVTSLAPPDRELVSHGLHVGRAIDEYKAEQGTGDFLIRGVIGADPDTGAVAVGDHLEVGQTVRFHVRDAATADEELRTLLEREVSEQPGRPAGALLFTCNGRGSRLFPTPDHDARLVSSYLGGVPMAGFFCAGELGPVGGKNFLHGFTASLAVFLDDEGQHRGRTVGGEGGGA